MNKIVNYLFFYYSFSWNFYCFIVEFYENWFMVLRLGKMNYIWKL